MLNIGCHLSSAKGYLHMGEEALALGANTFQFFTRNPRGGRAKAIDTEDIRALLALMRENSFAPLLAHAPYTLNACSADSKIRDFARMVMTEDLQLLELLPGTRYNFHPGSHVKQGAEQGIIMIAELLNEILRPQQQTMVLLETMAGKGSEVGRNFTELRSIIDRVELQGKLGVCLDTCHVFDGGYDIVTVFPLEFFTEYVIVYFPAFDVFTEPDIDILLDISPSLSSFAVAPSSVYVSPTFNVI